MYFLYQVKPGACPKSYGMNVARIANMPQPIVDRATQVSEKFERVLKRLWYNKNESGEVDDSPIGDMAVIFKELVCNGGMTREELYQLQELSKICTKKN